ncbi:XdhC/CoxI family protein [Streptomyces albofaciens JCM 4342]|uniref:XdhC family protein n=1 Tax=Streptomyces albofaciens TaxID=66866 RepID=UPI00123964DC|nr:XdhC/CoxI family protein [Streptomyces albofaciens]KAA6213216.1 XdhC/CoxI family protein [Streptomyces albofaciens JCM 4342]
MLDIADELHRWARQGRPFAVATVVATSGSAPRQPGAALAVDSDGAAVGSVSGGCVEGAVYELCQEALRTGETVLERFGYSDDDAFAVGLTCGGVIDILITPVRLYGTEGAGDGDAGTEGAGDGGPRTETGPGGGGPRTETGAGNGGPRTEAGPGNGTPRTEPATDAATAATTATATTSSTLTTALAAAASGEAAAVARVVRGPAHLLGRALLVRPDGGVTGTLGGHPGLDRTAVHETRALLDAGRTATVEIGADGSRCGEPVTLLVESSVPAPRMIVFGAIDFAAALVRAGKFLGHHVTVCDARPVFATRARFPDADEIVVDWPHRYLETQDLDARAVLCVLTHDPKFDVPLLERALRLPVAYVGAMGSRRTHLDRLDRLRAAGLTELELTRLRSPIGLDLGARTPEETALSIAAEIIANRRGGTGTPLTGAHTPIHHDAPAPLDRIGPVSAA